MTWSLLWRYRPQPSPMRKTFMAALAATLAGCVSTPGANLAEQPRITTTMAANGVPVYETVEFIRVPTDYERTAACLAMHSGVDGQAVRIDDTVGVEGKAAYYSPKYSKDIDFVFSLHATPKLGKYVFSRIMFASDGRTPLFATSLHGPESSYGVMKAVVDRVDACAR